MSEQANQFKLGMFVIVAVALLLGGAAMLGAGAFLKKVRHAETYFAQSVDGLDVGTAVKYRGVTVGRVSHIGLASRKYPADDSTLLAETVYVLVEMEFPEETKVFSGADSKIIPLAVQKGFRVRPALSGIVGGMHLELVFVDDPSQSPPLALRWQPEYPYIPSTESRILRITGSLERIATQLERVDLDQTIHRFDSLVTHLDAAVQSVDAKALNESLLLMIPELRNASVQVNDVLSSPAMESVLKDMPEITARLRSTTKQIDDLLASPDTAKLLANLNGGVANVGATASDLRKVVRRLDSMLTQQQEDIQRIVTSLRRTLDNTSDLTEDARQNPSRLLFGEPPPKVDLEHKGNK